MPDSLFALVVADRQEDFHRVAAELRCSRFISRCVRVETKAEYLAQLQAKPDVILADYSLPGFDALWALKLVQDAGLDIPVIVLTSIVSEETVVECMKRGAADYLLKDRLVRLRPAVARALREKELRQEKQLADSALMECSLRFRSLAETTKVIPWELDLETWRFTYVGPQAPNLTGYPIEDWYGAGFWAAHVDPEGKDALLRLRESQEATPRDHDFECRLRTASGASIYLHCVVKTLTIGNRNRISRGLMVDITELKQTQLSLARYVEALSMSNADLQQFANAAAHDLREPLRMVSFYTQLLARRYIGKLGADADEFIGYALEGSTRMAELINRLLEYSRVGAHKAEFAPSDCETILRGSMDNLKLAVEECGAKITHGALPVVTGDSSQLGQVFQNLLENALKFRNGKAPQIHVAAQERQDDWLFSVSDNSIGIEAQYYETIFLIFQKLHARDRYEGSGVGLAMCKKIVERHQGRIWVESEPQRGSTFFFTIPRHRLGS